jgi:hypothetical protein
MYTTTTPQAPSAHMLRPRAYAIGPKVNSLLSESSLSACKTWMLLQARTLCILRYIRGDHGEPKDQGQVCAGAKEGEGRRASCYSGRTSGPWPLKSGPPSPNASGGPRQPGHPAPRPGHPAPPEAPDIWRPITEAGSRQPGHPAPAPGHPASRESPDIRPDARTSGLPCLRAAHLGRGPCTPSSLRLYILPHLLLARVSIVIAHL